MDSDAGRATWGWLLGEGEARGIALVFLFSGLALVVFALVAFTTRSYRLLSEEYQRAPASSEPPADSEPTSAESTSEQPGAGESTPGAPGATERASDEHAATTDPASSQRTT
jgi:DHA3 family multidrug efflux protein-like MFS transporter